MIAAFCLRILLLSLGAAAILIGLMFVGLGPASTGEIFAPFVSAFGANSITDLVAVSDLGSVNSDSELRFYSVFWIAFGVLCVHTGLKLKLLLHRAPWLALVFFCGGLARLVSVAAVGWPHVLFTVLMFFELVLPIFLFVFWRMTRSHFARGSGARSAAKIPAFLNKDA